MIFSKKTLVNIGEHQTEALTLVNITNDYNSLRRERVISFASEADTVIGDVCFALFALRSF